MIPPRSTNSSALIAGQMISAARLNTKKQCSTDPQWTPIRASGASCGRGMTPGVPGPSRLTRAGTRTARARDGRHGHTTASRPGPEQLKNAY